MKKKTVKSKRYDELMSQVPTVKKRRKLQEKIDKDIDSAYVNLASAIIESATKDYTRAGCYIFKRYGTLSMKDRYIVSEIVTPIPNLPKRNELVKKVYFEQGIVNRRTMDRISVMNECIRFFKSEWCYLLSGINNSTDVVNELNRTIMEV